MNWSPLILSSLAVLSLCGCAGTRPIEVSVSGAAPSSLGTIQLIQGSPAGAPTALEAEALMRLQQDSGRAGAPDQYLQVAYSRHPMKLEAFDPAATGRPAERRRARKSGEVQVVTVQVLSAADGKELVRVRASQPVRHDRADDAPTRLLDAAIKKLSPAAAAAR